jgi:hypothetical protein
VLASLVTSLAFAVALFAFTDDIAFFAVTGANPAAIVAVAKMRQLDPADGNADQVFAFFADQFAFGEKLAEIVADAAFNDLAKTLVVFFDLQDHCVHFLGQSLLKLRDNRLYTQILRKYRSEPLFRTIFPSSWQ